MMTYRNDRVRSVATLFAVIGALAASPRAVGQHAEHPAGHAAAAAADAQRVRLVCLIDELKFDLDAFTVVAGKPVELTLVNPSDMPHNLIVCQKGEADIHMAVAMEAWALPDAFERQYVPDSPRVLHHTRLLNPGEEQTIHFAAPSEPGDYPYVCTIPGHAMTMWGIMHVVAGGAPVADVAAGRHAHAAVEPHPHLKDVTYQYYEGDYPKLPDFDALPPKLAGVVSSGRIDLPTLPRKEYFAVVLKGALEVPRDGAYAFAVRSDDGARVLIDGKIAVNHDGRHPVSLRVGRPIELKRGTRLIEAQYFNASSNKVLQVAWSGPGLDEMQWLSTSAGLDLSRYFLKVGDEARVQRGLMPDSSPRSIAVGLPGGTNYCFDAEKGFVRYGWSGHYLDVGPEQGYGESRGGNTLSILGDRFNLGSAENPLRIGNAGHAAAVEFLGYTRAKDGPTFLLSVDGHAFSQQVTAVAGKRGLRFAYVFESIPRADVFFKVDPKELELSSSAGAWEDGLLRLTPEQARSFDVTIAVPDP